MCGYTPFISKSKLYFLSHVWAISMVWRIVAIDLMFRSLHRRRQLILHPSFQLPPSQFIAFPLVIVILSDYTLLADTMAESYVNATPRLWSDLSQYLPEYRDRQKQLLSVKAQKRIHCFL